MYIYVVSTRIWDLVTNGALEVHITFWTKMEAGVWDTKSKVSVRKRTCLAKQFLLGHLEALTSGLAWFLPVIQ